ncbi:thioredoxin family protein [Pedobacter africanus]|uniref:Thioredoxin-like domain-containing protein n=1 Tax=Pedobacter africanus TaxID=151894 RepID=A0A1W2AX44_9SPHI|nr:thioredoxin family protein [Pedobacter africanus]SMC64758.1 Thioredoxin-like domain-containing protein [Pedobacter africanus]
MKTFKIYLSLMLLVLTASAQDGQFTTTSDWKSLLAQARKENKMVFVDAYFVGCHPCKQMDDEVFPLPAVMKQMKDNFVNVKIDFYKEDLGKELQVKYMVTGFPTFLLLNSDGQLVNKFSGYQEADKFQELLSEAVVKSKKGIALKGFSPALDVAHVDFYKAVFTERKPVDQDKLIPYIKGKDILAEVNAVPFLMTRSLNSELADLLLKNYNQFEALYGKDLVYGRRNEIMAARIKAELPEKNDLKFEMFLDKVKPLFSKTDWPYARLDMAEAYYYRQLKDRKAFFKYAAKNFNDDDNKIRYMAMYLYGDGIDEEEKQLFADWMVKVVSEKSPYSVLGTAAGMMKAQNDPERARLYAEWGIRKAKALNKPTKHFDSILN